MLVARRMQEKPKYFMDLILGKPQIQFVFAEFSFV
jgi:hypothetical protein